MKIKSILGLIITCFLMLSIAYSCKKNDNAKKIEIYDTTEAVLSLTEEGDGIDRKVTIESVGRFRLVFEAADNWGISQWYDLINDPEAQTNLAYSHFENEGVQEPGLFQMVWYGTTPNDPKLFMYAAKHFWPDTYRAFTIIENTPERIIVESVCHPLLAAGVVEYIQVTVRYSIYPDGKIYINAKTSSSKSEMIGEWRCAVLGLCDPTQSGSAGIPDTQGWIRSTETQSPYDWVGFVERYIFAYWSKSTGAPFTEWTKASIMLVSDPNNQHIGTQRRHSWNEFKRWYYTVYDVQLNVEDTIEQNYMIQLGAENSTILPNIINSDVSGPIADAYVANPVPPEP